MAATTRRAAAGSLTDDDFVTGGLPRETYINSWTIASIRYVDIRCEEGRRTKATTETIA